MPASRDTPLFRQEVFEARSQNWLGTISLAQPMRWPLMAGLALSLACAVLWLLAFGAYAPQLHVSGWLVATAAGPAEMQAEFAIPTRARPGVVAGDRIMLRLHESDPARPRRLPGRVATVARAVDGGPTRLRVDVEGDGLRPGMRVDAVVQGERRRLYEWAFAPLDR